MWAEPAPPQRGCVACQKEFSAHRSTSLARTNAQTLSAQSPLRACIERALLRTQARICEFACAVGFVLRRLEVASSLSMFERANERGRLIYTCSKCLRAEPAPGREGSSSRPDWIESALIDLSFSHAHPNIGRAEPTSKVHQSRPNARKSSHLRACMRSRMPLMSARSCLAVRASALMSARSSHERSHERRARSLSGCACERGGSIFASSK